jgi:hypothetical protein
MGRLVISEQEKNRPGRGRERTVDSSIISSQVSSAFYNAGEGWGAGRRVTDELYRLCKIGKNFAETGQWANAQVVYATVAEEAIMQREGLEDNGDITWVIGECAAGLVQCLEVQSTIPQDEQLDASEREELFSTLLELWKFGGNYGISEMNIPAVIARDVTEDERKEVEAWLRQEMVPVHDYPSREYSRRVIDFLVTLKKVVHFSDEELLEEYRNVGLYKELAEKLLQLGRRDEALEVAKAKLTDIANVIWFAEQLTKLGNVWQEQAVAFVEMRLKEDEHARESKPQDFIDDYTVDIYRSWLGEKYSLYGKVEQALDMALARFQSNPDDATYRSARSAAKLAGQPEELWPTLRPALLQTLKQRGRWGALVSIYLDEGEVGQALFALAQMERTLSTLLHDPGYRYTFATYTCQIQVAKAAEELYPDEALRLYKSNIQRLIDAYAHEYYQPAMEYLPRVKLLYQKQGREPEWNAYITDLRNKNKSLRALQEQLDKEGM